MTLDMPCLEYIGHMAVFYLPSEKLKRVIGARKAQDVLEDYLLQNFNAYTVATSNISGLWRRHEKSELFKDQNVRYEVSFEGTNKVECFVTFLSHLCYLLEEEAIYLTMGYKSYLVKPAGREEHEVRATLFGVQDK